MLDEEKSEILVVEDNKESQDVFRTSLEKRGYKVHLADDGEMCLKMLEELGSVVDVIIMDVFMPKMDGVTACKIIKAKEETSHIPIIATSAGYEKKEDDEFDDFFAKPVDFDELCDLIETWGNIKFIDRDL